MKVIGTTYSGCKMQHIKKDDGLPLWRADIQYDFLHAIFNNDKQVFTPMPDSSTSTSAHPDDGNAGAGKLSFADIYIDAIAQSEKTSKTLRQQLKTERTSAINIAMVCLLVNLGRMNTTLCFSPEMKAHLRTYHSIPCLQANVDDYEDHMYKQLQDAPRLKSILKRAADLDPNHIFTLEDLESHPPPRMNPISLIFLLSQYAPKISELHFPVPSDFYDLVLRTDISSQSRARAFLWLMWFYLESDFSEEAARNNPFGVGEVIEKENERFLQIPPLELLSEEAQAKENVDTKDEQAYGETMRRQRKAILTAESDPMTRSISRRGGRVTSQESYFSTSLRSIAPDHRADNRASPESYFHHDPSSPSGEASKTVYGGRTRSLRRSTYSASSAQGSQPLATRLVLKTKHPDASGNLGTGDPVTGSFNLPLGHGSLVEGKFDLKTLAPGASGASRRSRPMTQHQLALAQNRQQRIDHILTLRRAEKIKEMREQRKEAEKKTSVIMKAKQLLSQLPEDYDTDNDEEVVVDSHNVVVPSSGAPANQSTISGIKVQSETWKSWGPGALCPNPAVEEDYGELAQFYSSVLRKVGRRLGRWDWDASLNASKEPPETAPDPNPLLEPAPLATTVTMLPLSGRRGGRRRGVKRSAALLHDSIGSSAEKRPRTGGRLRAYDAARRRANRSSLAATGIAANADEGETESLSAVPARLQTDVTHGESSDVDVSNASQLNDGDMDEDIPSEPVLPLEDRMDESMADDGDTMLEQLDPNQSYRHDDSFTKPTLKSIDRLRPQSSHRQRPQGEHEEPDSETSSIAYPENDMATSDMEASAVSGDEGTSLAEGNDVGDDDLPDDYNVSDREGSYQPPLYSDTP